MPFSVRLFKRKGFPTKFPVKTPVQATLPLQPDLGEDEPVTEIERLGPSEHELYEKYKVRHEYIVRMEGKLRGQYFSECTRFDTFPCFSHRDKPWLLTSHVKAEVAVRAFRRLTDNKSVTGVVVEPASLALLSAMERLRSAQRVKGGWFGKLRIKNVEVAYLYGDHVTDSEDWEKYMAAGELNALQVEVPHSDGLMPILLTREAAVVFFTNLTERDYLEYATEFFTMLEDLIS